MRPLPCGWRRKTSRLGLTLVIGAHTDSLLQLNSWPRFPRISRRFKITQQETTLANAFGGLIYIDVPRDKRLGGLNVPTYGGYGWLDENRDNVQGQARVHIAGAVAAPLFVLGKTKPSEWQQQLAQCKAPWGELQCDRVVLTVRSSGLQNVTDPAALLQFWGKVIDTEAALNGWPRQPDSPERIVLDRETSAGWMHSGYPIMAHLPSERELLDLPFVSSKGSWGFFHELGHNHEAQAYTFGSDYVEVNVNLFSMFVERKLIGLQTFGHPSLRDIPKLLDQRLGPDKKCDPWTNLAMYIVTIDAFGWDPLQKTMASYSAAGGADGIRTREQKIDQWVLRYSRATGRNLAAYYALFGLNCSDGIKSQLSGLPAWIPAELAKYSLASVD